VACAAVARMPHVCCDAPLSSVDERIASTDDPPSAAQRRRDRSVARISPYYGSVIHIS
jgi:hypothetical protein